MLSYYYIYISRMFSGWGTNTSSNQAPVAASQPKDINNYDMDLKVYVRSGTPSFKLSNIVSPGGNERDSVAAEAAPGTFTDNIMKVFYGNDYNAQPAQGSSPAQVSPQPVTSSSAPAPVSSQPPAQGSSQPVTSSSSAPAPVSPQPPAPVSPAQVSSPEQEEVNRIEAQIKEREAQVSELNIKIKNLPNNVKPTIKGQLMQQKEALTKQKAALNNQKTELVNKLNAPAPASTKGGRRTRHVRKGTRARKSHRNRNHTKRYFEFF